MPIQPTTLVHPVVFTRLPQLEMTAGPMFNNTSIEDMIGDVSSNINWPYALWGYTLRYYQVSSEFQAIQAFWLARRGRAYGFFFRDIVDYTDAGHGKVVLINGAYRLVKEYPDTYSPYQRIITRPLSGTVTLSGVAGTGLVVDYTTGIIENATSAGLAEFQFHVPVKFSTDACRPTFTPNAKGQEATNWTNVDLREIRNYTIAS